MTLAHAFAITTGIFACGWFVVAWYAGKIQSQLSGFKDAVYGHEFLSSTVSESLKHCYNNMAEASQRNDQDSVTAWSSQLCRVLNIWDTARATVDPDEMKRAAARIVSETKATFDSEIQELERKNGNK